MKSEQTLDAPTTIVCATTAEKPSMWAPRSLQPNTERPNNYHTHAADKYRQNTFADPNAIVVAGSRMG